MSPRDRGASISFFHHPGILALYTALTIGMTYPVALNLNSDLSAYSADGHTFYWLLWWFNKSIMDLGTSPLHTTLLFYPDGVSFANHVLTPFTGLLGIPLQQFFGLTAVFNLLYMLTFVLSGYGAYLLVLHIAEDRSAAFLGGVIYAFSPFHILHTQTHLDLANIQFIPFYALFLIKLGERPRAANAIWAGIFLGLTALCSWNYFVFELLLTLIFVVYSLVHEREKVPNREFVLSLAKAGLTAFILTSPFLIPMLIDLWGGTVELSYRSSGGGARGYSADLAAFFIPSNLHPLWRDFPSPKGIYATLAGVAAEKTIFLGYTPLILGIAAAFRVGWIRTRFWLITFFVFMVLALGPDLQIFGEEYLGFTRLPYNWFIQKTPLLRGVRVPARFAVMCILSLSILAGWGLKSIGDFIKPRLKPIAAAAAVILVLFEFTAPPATSGIGNLPSPYLKIARDQENYALLEVPVALPQNVRRYMTYQTVHQKPILSGELARIPAGAWKFIMGNSFARLLHYPGRITPSLLSTLPKGLAEKKIKYVLVHNNFEFYTEPKISSDNFYHGLAKVVRGERRDKLLAGIHKLLGRHLKRSSLSTPEITVYEVY